MWKSTTGADALVKVQNMKLLADALVKVQNMKLLDLASLALAM